MRHITWVSLLAAFVLLVPLGAAAKSTVIIRGHIAISFQGPTSITLDKPVKETLVVTNRLNVTLPATRVTISPAHSLAGAKPVCKVRSDANFGGDCVWVFARLKPGASATYRLVLNFRSEDYVDLAKPTHRVWTYTRVENNKGFYADKVTFLRINQ